MTARITLATAAGIVHQLRRDHRTLALMLVVPCVLVGLLAWIFDGTPVFDRIGAALLGVFPFVVMFIVTSIATLRERTSGTLERLLTTPLGKGDLMLGYAFAFGTMAVVQALVATAFAVWVARLFTSAATTAKPRPASPARAASMVALSASRLVWAAMLVIRPTISPMLLAACARRFTSSAIRAASRSAAWKPR